VFDRQELQMQLQAHLLVVENRRFAPKPKTNPSLRLK
jgi:hypothetical protein